MSAHAPVPEGTFLGRNNPLARYVAHPVRRFSHIEAASGVMMLLATIGALVWANSPWASSYEAFWHTPVEFTIGSFHLGVPGHHLDLQAFVNDGLMAVFFFVVGIEIKRELVDGDLRDPRAAALPAIAALGGMIVPAGIFLLINQGTDASSGWGIPMATDIAFAVGLVSLLGNRIDRRLKVFLLSLAIVDDLGAIVVIALFYTETIGWNWFGAAAAVLTVVVALRAMRVWYVPLYVALGVLLWVCMLKSGVHATVAGVLMGFVAPAKPLQSKADAARWVRWLRDKDEELFAVDIQHAAFHLRESYSVAERMEAAFHPFAAFMIVPIFAFANAGIPLGGGALADAATSRVTWGVALGLVVGKAVGIALFTLVAARTPVASLPHGVTSGQIIGVSMVGGVGFTVSLFVTGLAFEVPRLAADSKIGILAGSSVAAIVGLGVLAWVTRAANEPDRVLAGILDDGISD